MENNFEWFNPKKGCPRISIASYGITLSKNTIEIMEYPENVKLGYSKDRNLLCIKVCDDSDGNKIKISSYGSNEDKSKYKRINSKDFISILNQNNGFIFNSKKTFKFTGVWDSKEKELIINLTDWVGNTEKESDDVDE